MADLPWVEKEQLPITEDSKYGLTVFSSLATGVLNGKYPDGVPERSRYDPKNVAANHEVAESVRGRFDMQRARRSLPRFESSRGFLMN